MKHKRFQPCINIGKVTDLKAKEENEKNQEQFAQITVDKAVRQPFCKATGKSF